MKPEAIPLALITHLHYDHWTGHALFPAAEFWIQQREIAFWTGAMARYEVYKAVAAPDTLGQLVGLNYGNRVRVVEGEREVLPGLSIHWVGGHTAGMQVVSVQTASGRVVLASDASHFYRNIERRQVAGHDPEVAARFKVIEPGVIRIA